MNEKITLAKQVAKSFAQGLLTLLIAATILTIPLRLIYIWVCFLWNLI